MPINDIEMDYDERSLLYIIHGIHNEDNVPPVMLNITGDPALAIAYATGAMDVLNLINEGKSRYKPATALDLLLTDSMLNRITELIDLPLEIFVAGNKAKETQLLHELHVTIAHLKSMVYEIPLESKEEIQSLINYLKCKANRMKLKIEEFISNIENEDARAYLTLKYINGLSDSQIFYSIKNTNSSQ